MPPPVPNASSQPLKAPYAPAAATTMGMWLFLAALFMLFAAGMVGYILIRLQAQEPAPAMHMAAIPPGSLHLPRLLWLSTALVIGVSLAIGRALHELRLERQSSFRNWLSISLLLAGGFLVVQAPAMVMLLAAHQHLRRLGLFLYGLLFILVLLHALHVIGGMVALTRVAVRAGRGVYDHEHYLPVRHAALYWHFLDGIWVMMFMTFLMTR